MNSKDKNKSNSSPCAMDDFPDYNGIADLPTRHKNEKMKIQSSNTIIYCLNWKACCQFYMETLKLEVRFSKDDWFHELKINDGSYLSIADQSRCSIKAAQGCGLTLSFYVEDLQQWHEHLNANGAETTSITTNSWRAPFFFVRDPDNNRIEFWTNAA